LIPISHPGNLCGCKAIMAWAIQLDAIFHKSKHYKGDWTYRFTTAVIADEIGAQLGVDTTIEYDAHGNLYTTFSSEYPTAAS